MAILASAIGLVACSLLVLGWGMHARMLRRDNERLATELSKALSPKALRSAMAKAYGWPEPRDNASSPNEGA